MQSLKILEKVKEVSHAYFQDSLSGQAISLEKKIETLHITRSMQNRPEKLTEEAIEVNERRKNITKLSNLALQMYSWYVKYGHARNEEEEKKVKKYFNQNLPSNARKLNGFMNDYTCTRVLAGMRLFARIF